MTNPESKSAYRCDPDIFDMTYEPTSTSPEAPAAEKCRAVKHGVVDLQCEHDRGHDREKDGQPGTWHEAHFTDRRQIDYDGAHHSIVITETVTWEPVDHAAEAVRHITAGANRSTS